MSILPTRGMGLWRGSFRGIPIEWQSPVKRPVHPAFVNLHERGGLGWLRGFNELMCRCGLSFNGPPGVDRFINGSGNTVENELTLHGRIANTPAHQLDVEVCDENGGTLSVTGAVEEVMMFGPALRLETKYSTVAGSNSLTMTDTVTNFGGQPTELQLLYHTNIGQPFLDAGAKLVAAIAEVAPRDAHSAKAADSFDTYPAPVAGFPEEAFFFDLVADEAGRSTVMLKNAAGDRGFSLSFAKQQLPCFTLWKNTQAEADGCVTGLEPGTNYPNLKTFEREQGRVITLAPGASYSTEIEFSVYDSPESVSAAEQRILALQTVAATVHAAPISKFSSTQQ
jgi:galactose mutarotase-like enzyme